jgi:hypothetical protein
MEYDDIRLSNRMIPTSKIGEILKDYKRVADIDWDEISKKLKIEKKRLSYIYSGNEVKLNFDEHRKIVSLINDIDDLPTKIYLIQKHQSNFDVVLDNSHILEYYLSKWLSIYRQDNSKFNSEFSSEHYKRFYLFRVNDAGHVIGSIMYVKRTIGVSRLIKFKTLRPINDILWKKVFGFFFETGNNISSFGKFDPYGLRFTQLRFRKVKNLLLLTGVRLTSFKGTPFAHKICGIEIPSKISTKECRAILGERSADAVSKLFDPYWDFMRLYSDLRTKSNRTDGIEW